MTAPSCSRGGWFSGNVPVVAALLRRFLKLQFQELWDTVSILTARAAQGRPRAEGSTAHAAPACWPTSPVKTTAGAEVTPTTASTGNSRCVRDTVAPLCWTMTETNAAPGPWNLKKLCRFGAATMHSGCWGAGYSAEQFDDLQKHKLAIRFCRKLPWAVMDFVQPRVIRRSG